MRKLVNVTVCLEIECTERVNIDHVMENVDYGFAVSYLHEDAVKITKSKIIEWFEVDVK